MVDLSLEDSCPPVGEEEIKRVEDLLSMDFPESYRRFLLEHNGGRPSRDRFPIRGHPLSKEGMVNRLLCIKDGDDYSITWAMSMYEGRVPRHFLVIGKDPGGNNICLSVAGEDCGKVYFWDHEEEVAEGEEPGYENVYVIADSFDQFLASLRVKP